MHEIHKPSGDGTQTVGKQELYDCVIPQIMSLLEGETDPVANLANTAAALKEFFGFFWVGFYLVKSSHERGEELVLGPFQGPVACTRIAYGRGVCGTAWKEGRTIVVEDVEEFPGHIACSSLSRSEIVVPLRTPDGKIFGVLDIDSADVGTFDAVDQAGLEKVAAGLSALCGWFQVNLS